MAHRLKVWGTWVFYGGGQRRAVVAATSKAQAAELLGVSAYHLGKYGCPTGNHTEVEIAMKTPGIAYAHIADVSAASETGEWVVMS